MMKVWIQSAVLSSLRVLGIIAVAGVSATIAQPVPTQTTPTISAPAVPLQPASPAAEPTSQPQSTPNVQPEPSAPVTPAGAPVAPAPSALPLETMQPVDGAPVVAANPVAAPAEEDVANANLPHDLSPMGMFWAADNVVKAVMLGLLAASVVTWTVWLAKTLEIGGAKRRLRRALQAINGARSLADAVNELDNRKGAGVVLVRAAEQEAALSDAVIDYASGAGLKDRVSSRLGRLEVAAGRKLGLGTGILATIGSVSPFVGLFGTVWGIMNSFIGISQAQSSSLAVVAPGIAEALLATAMGLVAAIPAVIFYNAFARSITGYRQMLADASAGIERLVSRDLDFRVLSRRTASQPSTLAAE